MNKIILASGSPRRKQLLQLADINFEVVLPDISEEFPSALPILEVPEYISQNKAREVHAQLNNNGNGYTIIAADTIVVLDDRILGKPKDAQDAKHMLNSLSGRVHKVITGVCLLQDGLASSFSEQTLVHFHTLSESQIDYYIKTYKPFDKAGAYGIQEWVGAIGIKAIEGDFYNVMGLPISRICRELKI